MAKSTKESLVRLILNISNETIETNLKAILEIVKNVVNLTGNKSGSNEESSDGLLSTQVHPMRKRASIIYEYVDNLPEGSVEVKEYNNWKFKDLFYHDGTFYAKRKSKPYKKLNTVYDKNGRCSRVNVNDENGVFRAIMLDKFKYYMSKKNPQG
jgi:hypothetical protein